MPGIRLDATAEQPLHRQLYRQLSHAIRLGHLKPIPALQGLDEAGRVIYLGTFSKVFFPALRLGYMVVPSVLIDLARIAQRVMSFHAPIIEQIAMTTFMAEDEFVRHIRCMRGLYEERRDCLLMHAKHYLDGVLNFDKTPSGLHLVGWLPDGADEPTLVQHANQHDLTVYPLSALRRGAPGRAGLLLGFAAFTETEIKAGVQQLAQVVRQG